MNITASTYRPTRPISGYRINKTQLLDNCPVSPAQLTLKSSDIGTNLVFIRDDKPITVSEEIYKLKSVSSFN